MFCSQCATEIPERAKYCPNCAAPQFSASPSDKTINPKPSSGRKSILKGRITGGKFFLWFFPCVLLGAALKTDLVGSPWDGVIALLYFASLPVAILAAIRRSHDLGRSGWFALICLVPFAGLYLIFKQGTVGANKYGPSPEGDAVDVAVNSTIEPKEHVS